MTLAELIAMFQSQRSGPAVPMSAAGVPLGNRPRSLQEIVNGAQVPNPGAQPAMRPPVMAGIRS